MGSTVYSCILARKYTDTRLTPSRRTSGNAQNQEVYAPMRSIVYSCILPRKYTDTRVTPSFSQISANGSLRDRPAYDRLPQEAS